jgi:hypothetical protein
MDGWMRGSGRVGGPETGPGTPIKEGFSFARSDCRVGRQVDESKYRNVRIALLRALRGWSRTDYGFGCRATELDCNDGNILNYLRAPNVACPIEVRSGCLETSRCPME